MENRLRIIASAWDLEIKVSEDGTKYMVGFCDDAEAEYIQMAEKLNGNILGRFNGGLQLIAIVGKEAGV